MRSTRGNEFYREQVLFESPVVRIGAFRCHPAYPRFADTGPTHSTLIVFPRAPVRITHAGGPSIVADPCTVMFYNPAQGYRRETLSERGDVCEWFAYDPSVVRDAVRPYDPAVEDREQRPFTLTHGPSPAAVCYAQRRVTAALEAGVEVDPLKVEETLCDVLRSATHAAYRVRGVDRRRSRPATRRAHRDLAEAVKSLLATRFDEPLRLAELARNVHSSPFHLSRVFREVTGLSIHAYRDQIRVRTGLDRVLDGTDDLAALAFDLGYSSHSHFASAFRRSFGVAPSAARRA